MFPIQHKLQQPNQHRLRERMKPESNTKQEIEPYLKTVRTRH